MDQNETLNSGVIADVKRRIEQMFYTGNREIGDQEPEQQSDISQQAWLYFVAFLALENLILRLEGKPTIRLNDGVTSLSHGLITECGRLVFRGAENWVYIYVHEHFCLVELPWDSAWTWYLAVLGVDFCYYWLHRACHEVHILWAQHQVHHSSEEYNLPVGLRHSILQNWCGFIFYVPLALVIPPAQFLTHQHINFLYQIWVHTRVVSTLGPLEWILNTPRHHRVHHGCNLYCLDKNYGGFLIIWDRIFGTFAEEHKDEAIIYGLVHNQPSFNPVFLQLFYNVNVIKKWKAMNGWQDKLAAIWKGPSWLPGKPRLGATEDKLDIRSREKYDMKLPVWINIYLCLHFVALVIVYQELALKYSDMTPLAVLGFVTYILVSQTVIGMMFDNRPHTCIFELTRCVIFVFYVHKSDLTLQGRSSITLLQPFFILSSCFWILQTFRVLHTEVKKIKKE
ncbi:Alkylglycerol monooxygenase [Cryptotermes secundus]|uniref:Alkylglycerol monooxygenase n=1 Tax=Cryptotermes secundus TaxID=105785 RepID=A0A2J7RTH3_9NEOP|nr:alkylglycerol monooxygenase isoform X1 [Cryptotermes secundus]XP_023727119.1 alkylglycerol monooxygenase isoform X1 [Cryptotermes secundus]XP_023727206.1 alkylglycerol monooxygenase isoform X1 [Cryptotermes secundus]PNF44131.1 Alkylglycerol monooxygenase [Cryptotermes secundus]PNF44133.1 Alkylglycerol monooxygenase [Cryptotermes secundus]